MPSRLVSLTILIYWSIAVFCLLSWDVLPEFAQGYPPDLRSITYASNDSKPVHWSLQVIDNPKDPDVRRTVGEAVTSSWRRPNGWFEIDSKVEFDAGGLLKGTLFAARMSMPIEIQSLYHVEPSGNLRSFDINVRSRDSSERLVNIRGDVEHGKMNIVSHGPVPLLNQRWTFDYEARSVVQNALGPLDRLPGLHVGQKWETRVVNPFTGQVDRARVEVARQTLIPWNGNPVPTFEVVQHLAPLSMRTWVTLEGLVLRQEVPFPFVRLVLERRQDEFSNPTTEARVPPP
jgi:hypothetical protein